MKRRVFICAQCKMPCERSHWRPYSVYCSLPCYHKHRRDRKVRACHSCKKPFEASYSQCFNEKAGYRIFCSHVCYMAQRPKIEGRIPRKACKVCTAALPEGMKDFCSIACSVDASQQYVKRRRERAILWRHENRVLFEVACDLRLLDPASLPRGTEYTPIAKIALGEAGIYQGRTR